MAIIFALRGDSLTPRYTRGERTRANYLAAANLATPPAIITATSISATGTRGSSLIDVHRTNADERAVKFRTGGNWITGSNIFSLRYSFVPNWTGNPASDQTLLLIGNDPNNYHGGLRVMIFDNGKLDVRIMAGDGVGTVLGGGTTTNALSFTALTKTEIMVKCDGTTLYASQDGVEVGSWALSTTDRYLNSVLAAHIYLGRYPIDTYIDELTIWDSAEAHVYVPAAAYETVDDYDATSYTTLTAAQVADGVTFGPGPGSSTGTLQVGEDPATSDVRLGVSWLNNSGVTVTGSLLVPAAFSGTSSEINFPQIKENIRFLLDRENTTTSSFDLSGGMNQRVQKIITLNPGRIPVQKSWYPFVTAFVEKKDIKLETIARNQSTAKRTADINLKIIGAVWNSKQSDKTKDAAQDDCEFLMENVESILRQDPTLSNVCLWQKPTGVTYFNRSLDEETHVRVGILSLDMKVDY